MPKPAEPGQDIMGLPAAVSPGLTIVVLTRERRELLRGCLASLFAQEDPGIPLRFVVVDDGSSDGTAEMLREQTASRPECRCVFQARRGIAAARNAGIRSSRSALTAIVADDYLLPANYARTIADFFRGHPRAQVLRFRVVPSGDGFLGRALHAYQEASVARRLAAPGSTARRRGPWRRSRPGGEITIDHALEAAGGAAFRSAVFRAVGGFDESFTRGEDTEFTRRLREAGIAVHYMPGLEIVHRNDPRLGPALRNAYENGRASRRLLNEPGRTPAGAALHFAKLALRSVPAVLYWSCWRAWQTGRPDRFLAYWPVLLLLEGASRAGFLQAAARPGRPA